MPELPEVETVKCGLAPAMEGGRIVRVEVNRPNLRFPFPKNFAARLEGKIVVSVGRRAKYLTVYLDNDEILVMHLGMSGSFHVQQITDENKSLDKLHHERDRLVAHDHVVFHLEGPIDNHRIIYNDPRRFGFMELIAKEQFATHKLLVNLGIEPTGNSLDGARIAQLFDARKSPLKSALLDQKLIAGLGNIYVCEALWQSSLSPLRIAGTISSSRASSKQKATALADAIRDVIARAIEAGGSSLNDHRQTDGTLGYFQHGFNVYDRESKDCRKPDCKGTIKRIVQSGRSTYFCPACQK